MSRVMHLFPRQGDREPWMNTQNFAADKKMIASAPLEDGALIFADDKTLANSAAQPERAQSAG